MPIPVAELIHHASDLFSIPVSDITGPRRFRIFVRPRQAVCLAARISGRLYSEIGRAIGGRDRTTAEHACGVAELLYRRDADFQRVCDALIQRAKTWQAERAAR